MKKLLLAGAAAAAITVTGLGVSPSASAAPASSPSDVTIASCLYKVKAKEAIKIRTSKKKSATALGVLPKGKTVCSDKWETGGKYNYHDGCNNKHDWKNAWDHISYKPKGHRTIKGWVPSTCLKVLPKA
ncbi:hypothetical protein [Actinoallomurus vinaceus]|uniref:hypothetical protein n=1 Tax=Actinoallomurus vinaceus TaxID=1080074 RepID=UPI0031E9D994